MPAFVISAAESGVSVTEALHRRLKLPRHKASRLISERRVYLNGKPCLSAECRVKRGQRLEVRDRRPEGALANTAELVIRYMDPHVVVVEKPAGLTTIPHAQQAPE